LLHQKSNSYSDKVLTGFLTTLKTGDDDALRKETITLPSAHRVQDDLNQQQSVLLMAAWSWGRAFAHILDAAHKDFHRRKAEYAALLRNGRSKAALMAGRAGSAGSNRRKRRITISAHGRGSRKWLSPEI